MWRRFITPNLINSDEAEIGFLCWHSRTFTHSDPVVTLLGFSPHSTGSTVDSYCHGNQELASLDTMVSPSSAAPLFLFDLPLPLSLSLTPHLMFPHSLPSRQVPPQPSCIFFCLFLLALMTIDCLFCLCSPHTPPLTPNCYSLRVFHKFHITWYASFESQDNRYLISRSVMLVAFFLVARC